MSQRVSLLMSGPALCLILVSYPYVKTRACGRVEGTKSRGQYISEASFVVAFFGKRSSLRILAGGSSVSSMFRLGWAFLDDHVRSGWPVKPWTNSMLFFHVSELRSRSVMTVAHSRVGFAGSTSTVRPVAGTGPWWTKGSVGSGAERPPMVAMMAVVLGDGWALSSRTCRPSCRHPAESVSDCVRSWTLDGSFG